MKFMAGFPVIVSCYWKVTSTYSTTATTCSVDSLEPNSGMLVPPLITMSKMGEASVVKNWPIPVNGGPRPVPAPLAP